MYIYLVRHGKAEPPRAGVADAERTLTESGWAEMRRLSVLYANLGFRPERLFSSPLRRARQTAQALAEILGRDIELFPALHPEGDPQAIEDLLTALGVVEHVMLVGHQPLLGVLIRRWTYAEVPLHPGTVAAVDLTGARPAGGRLTGLYEPNRLLRLAQPPLPPNP